MSLVRQAVIAMKTIKVLWTDFDNVYERIIANADEGLRLVRQLEEIDNTAVPPMMEFSVPNNEMSFTYGVGRIRTVLTYNESLKPPYYISLGDLAEVGVITFCWGNQETEYLARNTVSVSEGKKALTFFLEHLSRPTGLIWEKL